jgi:orotate phosphoribosyltransferase
MNARDRLRQLISERALLKGDFALSSGGQSSIYFNCKLVTLHPEGVALLGQILMEEIAKLPGIAAIGGPSIGADPVVGYVAGMSHAEGKPVSAFIVRKRPKEHGTNLSIENSPPKGSRVVIFEDVVTTGRSTLEAIRTAEREGLEVAAVISLVDREEGGAEALSGYNYNPLFRRSDFSA